MKICGRCKDEKPFDEFGHTSRTKDGYQRSCKDCRKLEQAEYYQKNKEFVKEQSRKGRNQRRDKWNDYKDTLSCEICGESHSTCLDFHHKNPDEKDFALSEMRKDLSWDKLMDEVKKCIVLCKNCHVKVHDGVLEI